MIATTTNTLANYIPYVRERNKASRRNTKVRNEYRLLPSGSEADIPEEGRLLAHIRRRMDRQTKSRWARYASECFREIENSDEMEREAMQRYLDSVRLEIDRIGLKRARRVRTREKHTIR